MLPIPNIRDIWKKGNPMHLQLHVPDVSKVTHHPLKVSTNITLILGVRWIKDLEKPPTPWKQYLRRSFSGVEAAVLSCQKIDSRFQKKQQVEIQRSEHPEDGMKNIPIRQSLDWQQKVFRPYGRSLVDIFGMVFINPQQNQTCWLRDVSPTIIKTKMPRSAGNLVFPIWSMAWVVFFLQLLVTACLSCSEVLVIGEDSSSNSQEGLKLTNDKDLHPAGYYHRLLSVNNKRPPWKMSLYNNSVVHTCKAAPRTAIWMFLKGLYPEITNLSQGSGVSPPGRQTTNFFLNITSEWPWIRGSSVFMYNEI